MTKQKKQEKVRVRVGNGPIEVKTLKELKELLINCETPEQLKELKNKAKGIDACMLNSQKHTEDIKNNRKVLNAKEEVEKCQQKNCEYFKQGCKPCKECGNPEKIIGVRCRTCFDCENKPNSLRWNNKEDQRDNKNILPNNFQEAVEELALKQELSDVLAKIQEFQKKHKEDKEEQKVEIPSYLG